jgi:hypothetical protein
MNLTIHRNLALRLGMCGSLPPVSRRTSLNVKAQLYFILLHVTNFVEAECTPVITQSDCRCVSFVRQCAAIGFTCHWNAALLSGQ